ncbi:MAG: hypothetical protein K0Q89_31 [Thermomicrobiales bacterium]|jgi:hypothetical protein|nr:hypothetical protein [Thermomicrobiales bacterium]
MSALDDAIEEIEGEQEARSRIVCELDADDDVSVSEYSGIDIVVRAPGDSAALIARVSWGDGDIAVDLRAYVDQELAAHDGVTLGETTSIWATRGTT